MNILNFENFLILKILVLRVKYSYIIVFERSTGNIGKEEFRNIGIYPEISQYMGIYWIKLGIIGQK